MLEFWLRSSNREHISTGRVPLGDGVVTCSDSGPAGYFLGFNIYRDRATRKLYMSQEHYFQSILE
jgi:hypothetical protein